VHTRGPIHDFTLMKVHMYETILKGSRVQVCSKRKNEMLTPFFLLKIFRIVIEWREREHEDIDNHVLEYLEAMESLRH